MTKRGNQNREQENTKTLQSLLELIDTSVLVPATFVKVSLLEAFHLHFSKHAPE